MQEHLSNKSMKQVVFDYILSIVYFVATKLFPSTQITHMSV